MVSVPAGAPPGAFVPSVVRESVYDLVRDLAYPTGGRRVDRSRFETLAGLFVGSYVLQAGLASLDAAPDAPDPRLAAIRELEGICARVDEDVSLARGVVLDGDPGRAQWLVWQVFGYEHLREA